MIQGTVHRIFNATNDWQPFDVSLKKNQEIWTENQYPTEWSSSIVNETLDKIVTKSSRQNHPKMNNILKKLKALTIGSLYLGFLLNTEEKSRKILQAD